MSNDFVLDTSTILFLINFYFELFQLYKYNACSKSILSAKILHQMTFGSHVLFVYTVFLVSLIIRALIIMTSKVHKVNLRFNLLNEL